MKKVNIVQQKSYEFALLCVKLFQKLSLEKKEYILSKQILRSGTSVGANIEEAIGGQSSKDFLAKVGIAYKEARETHFWLRLLRDSDYISNQESIIYMDKCEELLRIIGSIQKTLKAKNS